MSKLSKLWLSARSRVDKLRPSIRTGLALGAALTAVALLTPLQAQAAGRLRVDTKEGPVKGFLVNGVAEFLGIPYATPPVGDLRWTPPKPHAPWTTVLKATAYANTCAQVVTLGVFAGPPNNNEDCLYLNVFTPNLDKSAGLPVVFWIHGGGNIDGESNDYDGTKLASDGKTVVVTINYRLNLMGFLAHPALDAEGHLFGNYGILDQQLALKWVKRNIREFGGDPNNVTVGGQSAGASDTMTNVVSPLAAGLFDRAIAQSGITYFTGLTPLSFAETRGVSFAVAAGCGSGTGAATAKCLRSLTAAQVEALAGTASASSAYITYLVEDGQIIPGSFTSAFQSGNFNHMPIMNGTVEDEGNFGLAGTEYFKNPQVPFTATDFTNYVTNTYSGNAGPGGSPPTYPAGTVDKVFAQYPLSAYATPQLALDAVMTDPSACRSLHASQLLAGQVPVYGYEFRDQTAPFYFPPLPGFVSLAYHTADIQYLFPLYHGGPAPPSVIHQLNSEQQDLSDQLVAAWTNFAWTGNPNGLGNSPWPRYKGKSTSYYLSQDIPTLSIFTEAQLSAEHKCGFWQTILIYN
jgi:para-nitrobenzyl esterase